MHLPRLGRKRSSNKTLLWIIWISKTHLEQALNRDLIIKKAFNSQDKGKKTCAYPKVENGRQRPKTH